MPRANGAGQLVIQAPQRVRGDTYEALGLCLRSCQGGVGFWKERKGRETGPFRVLLLMFLFVSLAPASLPLFYQFFGFGKEARASS